MQPHKITNLPLGSSAFLCSPWCQLSKTSRLDRWSIRPISTATSAFGRCFKKHQSKYLAQSSLWSRSVTQHHQALTVSLQRFAERGLNFSSFHWLYSNNTEICSCFFKDKMQLYGIRSSCGPESLTQSNPFLLSPYSRLRDCQATISLNRCFLGVFGVNWCWLEIMHCSEGQGKDFCRYS